MLSTGWALPSTLVMEQQTNQPDYTTSYTAVDSETALNNHDTAHYEYWKNLCDGFNKLK